MQKQLEIFKNEIAGFKKESGISGVLLTGSVAYGTATETSDLDIVVLCEKDEFVSKYVNGILVEIHFYTFETIMAKLEKYPMEVYRYLYAKMEYDSNGKLNEIMQYVRDIYENYMTPVDVKKGISYWLSSTSIKLTSALQAQDALRVSYLLATNTWKVLEGVWAVNNKPMPPSGLAFFCWKTLKQVPCENWFTELLTNDVMTRGHFALDVIGWILKGVSNFNIDSQDNGQ